MLTKTMERPAHSGTIVAPPGMAVKPVLCYRLDGTATLLEGFEINLEHPQAGAALCLGEDYLPLYYKRPCAFDKWGTTGIVRRAMIERAGQGQVLSQPKEGNLPLLLHVNPVAELPSGAKLIEKFWTGVNCGTMVAKENQGFERVLSFVELQTADIFYSDGRVVRVMREHGVLTLVRLDPNEQADLRIMRVQKALKAAQDLPEEVRIPRTDACYHELVAVMGVGGAYSEQILDKAYGLLEEAAGKGAFSFTVQEHALKVLRRRSPTHADLFSKKIEIRNAKYTQKAGGAYGSVLTAYQAPKGTPAAALKRKRDRAERDRAARMAQKGPSNGGGNSQKSSQDKGKKGKNK